MYNKYFNSVLIFLLIGFNAYSQSINKFADDFVKSFAEDTLLDNPDKRNICKIEADFNSDGIRDIAFRDTYLCGAHACNWELYFGLEDGNYEYFSQLWFHNYAIKIDSISKGISKIYIYDKAGGGEGNIIEYQFCY